MPLSREDKRVIDDKRLQAKKLAEETEEGLTYEEAAKKLGFSPQEVKHFFQKLYNEGLIDKTIKEEEGVERTYYHPLHF